MYDLSKPHPLLAQIPLTVSPFVSLPTAMTLPYTYKSVPSTLPPSVLADGASSEKARYVVSSGGHAAHPDEIIASCQQLEDHINKLRAETEATIREWEESNKARELAEKRRVAPGWLDREEKLLQPIHSSSKAGAQSEASILEGQLAEQSRKVTTSPMIPKNEGEELDRAFGGLALR
ncbi:uncharacterized protein CIMG_06666 [Coccidioides immitis RS]|uniref:Uncharacterized protein n=1 Tax=Coccidioides immitis (strain RS) TaxID=246410 RepID=J3K8M6_COCIM|nr:uncharacterized protein CIMG_06666 [Coccidioides immitis RS]EAS31187.3 hypothetical protein CIMG_06666 [Coccidioides immitis RS]